VGGTSHLTRLWIQGPEGPAPGPHLDLRPLASAPGLRFVSVTDLGGVGGVEDVLKALPRAESLGISV